MIYRFVTLKYRKGGFTLFCRDKEGIRRAFRFMDFDPYFYIRQNEPPPRSDAVTGIEKGYTSLFGIPLQKVKTSGPGQVGKIREDYDEHWEADIPIERRFLVNSGISDYFKGPENSFPSDVPLEISWTDLTPIESGQVIR